MALDLATLMVAASFVAAISGAFLLLAWIQCPEARGAPWWAAGNLVLASAGAFLASANAYASGRAAIVGILLLNIHPGLVWAAARICNGRRVDPFVVVAGTFAWVLAFPLFRLGGSIAAQISLSLGLTALYLFATAFEFWRERADRLVSRGPLIVLVLLHAVFAALAATIISTGGLVLGAKIDGWLSLVYCEALVFVIGTAIFAVAMGHERGLLRQRDEAAVDSLTGVATRRAFMEAASAMLARAVERSEPLSLIVFDLDSFKSINDAYGHAVGDRALRTFGGAAQQVLRSTDFIGRLGGEEFAVALPGSSIGAAYVIAERIRVAFAEACRSIEGNALNATVSAGVTTAQAGATLDSLIAAADGALYNARRRAATGSRPGTGERTSRWPGKPPERGSAAAAQGPLKPGRTAMRGQALLEPWALRLATEDA
jgi:diguanylate cyclase (GGDEF)-like protein